MRGADKLLEHVEGVPLLRRVVEAALAAGLEPWVALPGAGHPRADALAGLDCHRLVLAGSAEGLGGTLRDGVAALSLCSRFMILAADLPGLTVADLSKMALAVPDRRGIVIATSEDGALGHPVVFDAALRPEFAGLSGDEGAKPIVHAHKSRMQTVMLPSDHATRDLDTPEDWEAYRAERSGETS